MYTPEARSGGKNLTPLHAQEENPVQLDYGLLQNFSHMKFIKAVKEVTKRQASCFHRLGLGPFRERRGVRHRGTLAQLNTRWFVSQATSLCPLG
ncbi:hypothetical protein E2C01_049586 [Portunus trituberculatus]|uniref:Uncharacterized protein n=1 Tax=Portunus trituberculatus TaxID=210409 RepID=A0A5B7G9V4_PORTR|nr:hypothetical protein [Portunus trituberculatus]